MSKENMTDSEILKMIEESSAKESFPEFSVLQGCEGKIYILKEWKKSVGEQIECRDTLAIVEADTVTIEIECYDDGIVSELYYKEGNILEDRSVLAKINNHPTRQ